jgi:tRNA (guanine37-N1)-methyltransferase
MKNRALRVPRDQGEQTRRRLLEQGGLRVDLKISEEGEWVLLPLTESAPPLPDGTVVEHEFAPVAERGPRDYRDLLASGSEAERDLLPRSYDVIGDVVLVRLPSALAGRARDVGHALLEFIPGARVVGADYGVHGPERRRELECIAGAGPWRTRHRENGIEFDVDPGRAYFSPRLAREHALVAEAVGPGDRVYDLCCGVGPFALTIARVARPRRVVAVDSNPAAIELLRSTASRYHFGARVEPVESPVDRFLEGAEPVERAILNLPHEGIKYLTSVGTAVTAGGRFFYYEVTPRADREGRPDLLVDRLGGTRHWREIGHHVVHPYSPAADLVGYVFERLPD